MSSWWIFHLQFLFRCLCILCKVFFQYLSHLSYMWIAFWSSYSCYSMECSSWVVHKNQHHVISILWVDWLSWLVKCAVAGLMLDCIFALQHISWELQHCAVDNWRLSDQHTTCFIEACPSPSHWYAVSNGSMWQSNLRGKGYYSVTKICCTLNDFGACKWWFKLMN
jgi:hypothetical protein